MLRRITADLDFKNPFRVLFYVYRAMKLNPKEIYLKPSNSKGYHLIVWVNMNKYNGIYKFILGFKTHYEGNEAIQIIREWLGDDKQRRQMDKKRDKPRQYLFYKKVKRRCK